MFGQTFEIHDLAIVAFLVVLEGVLSIDNALVLGLLARRLPKEQQGKALTYGLIGAFLFRFIAIATAAYLLQWRIVKLLGGAYLIYVAAKHFFFERSEKVQEKLVIGADGGPVLVDSRTGAELCDEHAETELGGRCPVPMGLTRFWPTVVVIELTDIAFAVDSIVAAMGTIPAATGTERHPKLWVVMIGGFLGVVVMRFAAVLFIKLLDRFPRFELAAYLLVVLIGLKLVIEWAFTLDFHHPSSPAFWIFWGLMLGCFMVGFMRTKRTAVLVERG